MVPAFLFSDRRQRSLTYPRFRFIEAGELWVRVNR
jgi:hypothetical protein